MEPTPAEYGGITFSALVVAQWACFLDALNIRWSYNPLTLEDSHDLKCAPDFWLPEQHAWLEILSEGSFLNPEQNTAVDLYRITSMTVLVFIGFPDVKPFLSNSDNTPVQEICNFGIALVNQQHPTRCMPLGASTLNEAMQSVLGMITPSTDSRTFRANTLRINSAASRANHLFRDNLKRLRFNQAR